jgi:hypothetical protein
MDFYDATLPENTVKLVHGVLHYNYGACDNCKQRLDRTVGVEFRNDLQEETKFGHRYPSQTRYLGSHKYCAPCAAIIPPNPIRHVWIG